MNISYLVGDATQPQGSGAKIIVHVCNDIGKWGKGFVLAVSRRWPQPEAAFKAAYAQIPKPALGDVQWVPVEADITVANLIGQHKIASRANQAIPIRYDAVRRGLEQIAATAAARQASVHMPRIGCGLAGGKWEMIEPIVQQTLLAAAVPTFVYDFV